MSAQVQDTLSFPLANAEVDILFDPETLALTLSPARALEAGEPVKVVGNEVPQRASFAVGDTMLGPYCNEFYGDPRESITLVAIAASPYARVERDPTAALCALPDPTTCDLGGTASYNPQTGLVTISVTTTAPPFSARLYTGQPTPYVPGQTTFAVPAGSSGAIQVKDARNCVTAISYSAGAGGGTGPSDPEIDQFTKPDGTSWGIYYQATPQRVITAQSDPVDAVHGTVTAAVRGRAADSLITEFCEGFTRVRIRAKLSYPYAYLDPVIVNSLDCGYTLPVQPLAIVSKTENAATAQDPGKGSLQLVVSGGAGQRTLFVPGVTPVLVAFDADGAVSLPCSVGSFTAIIRDSSLPPYELSEPFVIAPYVEPPLVLPPALPNPAWQNLETFPFSSNGTTPDAQAEACLDAPYYLAVPTTRFLPFCLRRLRNPARWLDCARVVDALTGYTVFEFPVARLNYQKFSDAQHDYFLYYGTSVANLQLPVCRPLRLQVDEFTSPAFLAHADLSEYLRLSWWHDTPLQHLPYGTGLQQWLYIPGATLREQDPREERTETLNPVTAEKRVDFLAQARTVSFETEPLPAWLVQAVQGAKFHDTFRAGSFLQGNRPVKEVKQTAPGPDFCSRALSVTLEYPPVVVVGCAVSTPVLMPRPVEYAGSCD
jgi:hypothetical protein